MRKPCLDRGLTTYNKFILLDNWLLIISKLQVYYIPPLWGTFPMYFPCRSSINIAWLIYTGVSCGAPPPGTNVSPGTPTSTVYQGAVIYTCTPGYWISEGFFSTTATCMANRMWEPVLICSRKLDCNSFPYFLSILHSCWLWFPGRPLQWSSGYILWNHLHDDCYLHLWHWIHPQWNCD